MATTDIDVASQALVLCRANTINSFDQGTNEADIAGLYYPTFIKDIFSRYPWSFARKRRLFSQDSTAPVNEFAYRHIIPSEVQRIIAIYTSDQPGATPLTDGWRRVGKYIESNQPVLYGMYEFYPSENYWPGYFLQYAIYAFAALICVPISDDADRAIELHVLAYGKNGENERGGKFSVAASADSQSQPAEKIATPELILARFS